MALDDLKETIETLRERIQTHRPYLEGYETRTRQALIDPMLRALGWDVEDPNSVELEYGIDRKWADYALMGSERPIAVIEAKALGTELNNNVKMQVLNYANTDGIDYMAVTNGDHWQMFDVFKRGQLDNRILMNFHLTQDEPYACALQALGLWRPNLASGKPQEAITPVFAHHESATDQPEPSTPEPPSAAPSSGQEAVDSSESEEQNQDNWVPLTSWKRKTQKPPVNTNIKFPNSNPRPINHWIDIWVNVADYLIKTGKISEENCPVRRNEGTKTYLLHTEPRDRDGEEFDRKKEIEGLWLFTDFNPSKAHKNSCWLLDKFGVNPSTVRVSTNPS